MSRENKPYIRVQDDVIEPFASWELPQVGDGSTVIGLQRKDAADVVVVEEELAAEKITVAELEAIRDAARLEGLAAGLEEGRAQGASEGLAQGIEQGKQQGYQEGFAQGEAEVQRLQSLFAEMTREFETPLQDTLDQVESLLLQSVKKMSEAVIATELATRPELIQKAVRASLEQLPEPLGQLKVIIAAQDQAAIEQLSAQTALQAEIIVDEALSPGSYRLETANSLVTHDSNAQLKHVLEQMMSDLDPAQDLP